ncbi:MAG: adenylate/guanylate cyclase domain-containing protein [Myxococcales bacterium]|nr:adenylate/guanylate cyclase domain-containing protein [Myxococcales bacterium]
MNASPESDSVIANPLRASGLIDSAALDRARAYAKDHGGLLSDALLRMNLVKEGDFLRIFAELYSTRFVKSDKLKTLKLDETLLERVGVRSAERLRMCPIRWDSKAEELHVVAAIPLSSNLDAELRQTVGAKTITVYVATAGSVAALIRSSYYRDESAFKQMTPNGAGPAMPNKATETMDEEGAREQTHSSMSMTPMRESTGLHDEEQGSSSTEGKTVMVNINALADTTTIATLRRENARYRIAQEFHRRVTLERNLESMVDRILSVLFELMPAEGAAIWLTTGQFAAKSKDGSKQVQVPKAVYEQAINSEKGVLTHNALVDERFDRSASVMVRGIQSCMAVPLRTRNGVVGVLYVESISMSAAFTDDDLPLLDSIGSQAAILLDNAALLAKVRQEVERRAQLSRFLSSAAVDEVLSGRLNLKMEGAAAEVTVLFADLRGFTTLSAAMKPEEVVRFLNEFFQEAVDAIEKHHGTVDKFIGDCVMALWGAPLPKEGDARNACRAALELVERASRITVGGQRLEVGVGVHTGPAVVGALGSKQRMDYTAIGSTVNLSARLCGIARENEVLVTSDTLMRAGPGVVTEAGEAVILKGLDTPIVPYTLRSVSQPLQLSQLVKPQATQPGVPGPFVRNKGK